MGTLGGLIIQIPKKNSVKDGLLSMHFISKNAMKTTQGERDDRLINAPTVRK